MNTYLERCALEGCGDAACEICHESATEMARRLVGQSPVDLTWYVAEKQAAWDQAHAALETACRQFEAAEHELVWAKRLAGDA